MRQITEVSFIHAYGITVRRLILVVERVLGSWFRLRVLLSGLGTPMEDDMDDYEWDSAPEYEDDEWYCRSIARYNELVMFDLEDKVISFDLLDQGSLCLLCKKSSGLQVILEHLLPSKIYKKTNENHTVRDTDMKIKSGVFPNAFVLQVVTSMSLMCSLYNENKLITSEEHLSGVNIYHLGSSETDQNEKCKTISAPLLEPRVSVVGKNVVLLAKDTSSPPVIVDLSSGEVKCTINCTSDIPCSLMPAAVSETTIALCKETNGEVFLYDTRKHEGMWEINGDQVSKYSICTSFDHRNPSGPNSTIGTISANGNYKFYDLRNSKQELISGELSLGCDDGIDLKMKISPSGKKVSVSGHNGTVIVYDLRDTLKEIFCHDGHQHMEHSSKNTLITDHLWYDERCIISSADNHSLNCWQYIIAEN
ncbi:uncharacterized protein LOC106670376 isoform X1 [Cimex lectularius]|uniref:Uncharacterized protein n=2 Tax=Cimex lectularius TaxID=79782 RepID=A0A8I6TM64_CIMLE|nr:uncharacterized protein LOC106670376 isoform X1 [Cimex lectularius]